MKGYGWLLACCGLALSAVFLGQCGSGSQCISHVLIYCDSGVLYWVDGCGNMEDAKETCPCGCKADHSDCDTCACQPTCTGRCCGVDGCQNACANNCSATGQTCNSTSCLCEGSCQPQSCTQLGKECGTWDNGCGSPVQCPACPSGESCSTEGKCVGGGNCPSGQTQCGTACVTTSSDHENCGTCGHACSSAQVCTNGSCQDSPDCRTTACPQGYYCNLGTGACLPGCISDTQCGTNEGCDSGTHACVCKQGFHRCTGACVSDASTGSCGSSCTPCPQPAHSSATCDGASCGFACETGTLSCSGACAACPTAHAATFACSGAQCVAATCSAGYHACGGQCVSCPTAHATSYGCSSTGQCIAEGCTTGYRACSGQCTACPTANASSFACSSDQCVAAGCVTGYHVCSGSCVLEGLNSCGASCSVCSDQDQGACGTGACYGVVDFGYYPRSTSCATRCTSLGKTCGNYCNIQYTRPDGAQYQQVAGGHYTQQAAYEPWGFLNCADTAPNDYPTSIRCCCTDALTGSPIPGCSSNNDCGSDEFCWDAWNECYPTTDSRCPPGYTYQGECSDGNQFCTHSGLPAGTTYPFETACPAGTTQRGSFYCSGETKICVPD